MTIVFRLSDYCQKMAKNFKFFFGACFRYTLYELKQIVWKKTKMTKFDDFRKFFEKNEKNFQKMKIFGREK